MATTYTLPARRRLDRQRLQDAAFRILTRVFAFGVLLLLGGIVVALAVGALPAFRAFGWGFLTSDAWNPVKDLFGALPAIYGTLISSFIAMLIGIPLALGIAVFLTELCPPPLRRPIGTLIELLAAIPSIIYGIWGLFVLAPFLQLHVQPLLIDTLRDVPIFGDLFQGPPLGLGVLTAGIMLGLGRALGETMAVTFVIGNAHHIRASLLAPGTTISATLANEFSEAVSPLYVSSLIALGFILFVITFIVLAAAKLMLRRLERQAAK